jgi:hypothetical protein
MRILSYVLFSAAALISGCAILIYLYVTSLACGYALRASGCHAWPSDLGSDDRLWLVQLPALIVAGLVALGIMAHLRARSATKKK